MTAVASNENPHNQSGTVVTGNSVKITRCEDAQMFMFMFMYMNESQRNPCPRTSIARSRLLFQETQGAAQHTLRLAGRWQGFLHSWMG